jgi:hypothetical protein
MQIVVLIEYPAVVEPPPYHPIGTVPLCHPDSRKKLQNLRLINSSWCQCASRRLFRQVTIRPSHHHSLNQLFTDKYGDLVRDLIVLWDARPIQIDPFLDNLKNIDIKFPRLATLHIAVPVHLYGNHSIRESDKSIIQGILGSLSQCRRLEHLKFSYLSPLDLHPVSLSTEQTFEKLTSLEVAISEPLRRIFDDGNALGRLMKWLKLPKNLRSLRLHGNYCYFTTRSGTKHTVENLNSLTELVIDGISFPTDFVTNLLDRNKQSLRLLSLKHVELPERLWADIFDQLCQFPNLKTFHPLLCSYPMSLLSDIPAGLTATRSAPVETPHIGDYVSLTSLELHVNSTRKRWGLAELPSLGEHFMRTYKNQFIH